MGCSATMMKYLVYLVTVILALIGIALVVVGIIYKLSTTESTYGISSDVEFVAVIVIIIGAIILTLAVLGCFGAVREIPCLLITYAVILLAIFLVQVIIGAVTLSQGNDDLQTKDTFHHYLDKIFKEANSSNSESLIDPKEVRDVIQVSLECCGVDSPGEYPGDKPSSCCAGSPLICPSLNHPIFADGCVDKIFSSMKKRREIIGGFVIAIAVVEFVGAVLALCLSCSIKNQRRRGICA